MSALESVHLRSWFGVLASVILLAVGMVLLFAGLLFLWINFFGDTKFQGKLWQLGTAFLITGLVAFLSGVQVFRRSRP